MKKRKSAKRTCSFCFKRKREVPRLIQGPRGIAICTECIGLCVEICAEDDIETCDRCKRTAADEALSEEIAAARVRVTIRRAEAP